MPIENRELKHACCGCKWLQWDTVAYCVMDWRTPQMFSEKVVAVGVCMKDPDHPLIATTRCREWECRHIVENDQGQGERRCLVST